MPNLAGIEAIRKLVTERAAREALEEFMVQQYEKYAAMCVSANKRVPPNVHEGVQYAAVAENYRSLLSDLERFVEAEK